MKRSTPRNKNFDKIVRVSEGFLYIALSAPILNDIIVKGGLGIRISQSSARSVDFWLGLWLKMRLDNMTDDKRKPRGSVGRFDFLEKIGLPREF